MKIKFRPEKQNNPEIEGGVRLSYALARRTGYRFRGYLLLALIISPLLVLAWHLLGDKVFISAPGVVTTEPMEIRSSGSGFVEKLLVESGDHVTKGQKLAQITNPLLNTRIETLFFLREQLNSKLGKFDQAVLKQLKGALYEAQEGMREQLEISRQFKNATKRGIVSTINMATVINALTASRLAVRSAKTELERERRTQQLEQMTSPLIQQKRALLLKLAEAQSRIDTLHPIANTAAVVAEILVREGDWVEESMPLFLLTQRRKPFVYAFLDARYASWGIDGATVTIIFPSGTEVKGKIRGQTVLARRLPTGLAKPFESDKPALKVTIEITQEIKGEIETILVENLPVKVKFSQFDINSLYGVVN